MGNRTFFISRIDINRQIVNNKTSTRGLIKWKGCHVHSNIFIRLVSCYLCVSYLIASIIIINLLCYSDLNLGLDINYHVLLPEYVYHVLLPEYQYPEYHTINNATTNITILRDKTLIIERG